MSKPCRTFKGLCKILGRGSSYSQKSVSVSGSSRMRVQSPSPSRCRGSSYSRGRTGFQGQPVEVATEIHQHHANEKQEMQELNVRFAGYIEKVQALEQRNSALRAEEMYNCDPYNVLLSIATNIPVLLMTASVLMGHTLLV
uniref:IF rod domain-containing protein n=1 Tax=Cyprinus carpio TaxID=7962 RepID=A0A8C1U1V5_CYPCA